MVGRWETGSKGGEKSKGGRKREGKKQARKQDIQGGRNQEKINSKKFTIFHFHNRKSTKRQKPLI